MRLQAVILALAGVQQALAAAVENQLARLTDAEILRQLRENPHMLPRHGM